MFVIIVGVSFLEHPSSPTRVAIESAGLRRLMMGTGMGCLVALLTYSSLGKISGAHLNPAISLAMAHLGELRWIDALAYIIAQFLGATSGAFAAAWICHPFAAHQAVNYAVTRPPAHGIGLAFALELLMTASLMALMMLCSASATWSRATGALAGLMIVLYVWAEAPLSGMSINPARSFASACMAGHWQDLWIYVVAPPLGALTVTACARRQRTVA